MKLWILVIAACLQGTLADIYGHNKDYQDVGEAPGISTIQECLKAGIHRSVVPILQQLGFCKSGSAASSQYGDWSSSKQYNPEFHLERPLVVLKPKRVITLVTHAPDFQGLAPRGLDYNSIDDDYKSTIQPPLSSPIPLLKNHGIPTVGDHGDGGYYGDYPNTELQYQIPEYGPGANSGAQFKPYINYPSGPDDKYNDYNYRIMSTLKPDYLMPDGHAYGPFGIPDSQYTPARPNQNKQGYQYGVGPTMRPDIHRPFDEPDSQYRPDGQYPRYILQPGVHNQFMPNQHPQRQYRLDMQYPVGPTNKVLRRPNSPYIPDVQYPDIQYKLKVQNPFMPNQKEYRPEDMQFPVGLANKPNIQHLVPDVQYPVGPTNKPLRRPNSPYILDVQYPDIQYKLNVKNPFMPNQKKYRPEGMQYPVGLANKPNIQHLVPDVQYPVGSIQKPLRKSKPQYIPDVQHPRLIPKLDIKFKPDIQTPFMPNQKPYVPNAQYPVIKTEKPYSLVYARLYCSDQESVYLSLSSVSWWSAR